MRYRSLVRATEPAHNPVTLAEAKSHLRIDSNDENALISTLITAATRWVEDYLDRTLCHTQWTMRLDSFYGPVGGPVQFGLKADGNNTKGPSLDIELPRPPMVTASTATAVAITYTPAAGAATTTLDATEYRVDRQATPGVCRPLYGLTWPSHLVDQNSTTITWWAGYSHDGTDVPAQIKAAILLLVAHLWKNRESTTETVLTEVPMGTRTLLDSVWWGSYK